MATNDEGNCKTTGYQCLDSSGVMQGRTLSGDGSRTGFANGSGTAGNSAAQLVTSPISTMPTIYTAIGTPTIANAGTSTIFTPSGNGAWLVGAYTTDSATCNIHAMAYVISNSSGALTSDNFQTTSCTITISGSNVILTNTSGAQRVFAWWYLRIG